MSIWIGWTVLDGLTFQGSSEWLRQLGVCLSLHGEEMELFQCQHSRRVSESCGTPTLRLGTPPGHLLTKEIYKASSEEGQQLPTLLTAVLCYFSKFVTDDQLQKILFEN